MFGNISNLQTDRDKTEDAFQKNMTPFWDTELVYNEALTMVAFDGKMPEAPLMYPAKKILSVRSATLDTVYREGADWIYEDGRLKLPEGSSIPYFTEKEFYPSEPIEGATFPKDGGGFLMFAEGTFFHEHQLAVTYACSKGQWKGLVPEFAGAKLPNTMRMLKEERKLKLVLYGDSISAGANASGRGGVAPAIPIWGQMVADTLRDSYNADITFLNPSVGGKRSDWGVQNVTELVSGKMPDLVIIAFGMNDGTSNVPPSEFKTNIKSIIDDVRSENPNTEFLLVSTILPNKLALTAVDGSSFYGEQRNYKPVLNELCHEYTGTVLVNMTDIHQELLRHKRFIDMTGNNVNHPNDFLIRWYAQVISAMLVQ